MEERESGSHLKALSLNYIEAPIEIREQLAFGESETKALLLHLKEVCGIQEAMLLSTCNRTELYYSSTLQVNQVLKVFAAFRGLSSDFVAPYFQFFTTPSLAIRHLFRVGLGLESQVLGDLQIINQVKNAYQWCVDSGMAGSYFHRLLHAIFFANKKVVQETNFRSGSASVSYATKELVESMVSNKAQPITIYGLGEIGMPVMKNLLENGYTNITVCNRSYEKAAPFAETGQVKFLPWVQRKEGLSASVVISAISGSYFTIYAADLATQIGLGYQYIVDLGMPRSVQPEVSKNDRIILYNLDQVQSRVSEALSIRQQAIPQVESIAEAACLEFEEWTREAQVSPTIHLVKDALEQIRQEEMARFVKKADSEQAAWADELTKNLMQRIIKTHVVALKSACKRDEADQLAGVLQQLFQAQSPVNS